MEDGQDADESGQWEMRRFTSKKRDMMTSPMS